MIPQSSLGGLKVTNATTTTALALAITLSTCESPNTRSAHQTQSY